MTRVDYLDDPDAPAANSVVPSVTAIVTDGAGALLLVHKTDNDLWALPGGGMDAGEYVADAASEQPHKTGRRLALRLHGQVLRQPRHQRPVPRQDHRNSGGPGSGEGVADRSAGQRGGLTR